jgi:hypothetical protein
MPAGSYVPRRAGLSRNVKVEPLLSMFKAKDAEMGRKRKITEPDDPAAPPVSDSSSDDGDDAATSRRGDIRRTTFQRGSKPTRDWNSIPTFGARKSARTSSQPTSARSPKRPRDSEDEIEEPAKRTISLSHEDDNLGSQFRRDALGRKAVGSKKSYGKASASSRPVSTPEDVSSPQKQKPVFKPLNDLDDFSSPEKSRRRPVLLEAEDFAFTPSPKKTYQVHPKAKDDLDTPSPVRRFKPPPATDQDLDESSPEKPLTEVASSQKSSDDLMKKARQQRQNKKRLKEARLQSQQKIEDHSPEAVFKLPAGLGLQDDLAYDSDLEVRDATQLEEWEQVREAATGTHDAVCPMCLEPVAQEVLDRFSKKRTMTIAQQRRFCNHHKVKGARQTWNDRSYPDIDWSKLDQRIATHHTFLEDILRGGESHFGAVLAKNVKSGKNRTLLKADQNVTPGYYGSRGARIMNEYIINHFSDLLRKVAVQDRLVSARGHMVFVQFVLVPELAVRLIMEDMDVSPDKARIIMEESQKVGNLLNEEEDDIIIEQEVGHGGRDSTSSLSSLDDTDLS